MANKYIKLAAGRLKEQEALVQSAGAGDAGKIPALDGTGKLDPTVMPNGIAADTMSCPASEALSAGALVNVWLDTATVKARKADATVEGKEAHGYTPAAVDSGATATVYFDGTLSGLSGMTPGARQFLSATAGGRTETPPSTSGNVVQCVGVAISATELSFEPHEPITVA